MPEPSWPDALLLVRHGESSGNVARDRAEAAGAEELELELRDMDVDLSERGQQQAEALGRWLGTHPAPPTVALVSPYLRARRTAELAVEAAGLDLEVIADERLREREFGHLDGLTHRGIEARFPAEAAARSRIGKFYHRPPGGESWCDVGLRVRSALDSTAREHAGERVLVVAHQVVVYMFRYVLERLDERQIIEIARSSELANCSVSTFVHDPALGRNGGMRLERFNETTALEGEAPLTATTDPVPGGQG